MATVSLSTKGWVVIPAELRRKYHLTTGSRLLVVDYGGVLSLVPVLEDPIQQAKGLLKGASSLTRAVVEAHRQDVRHE